MELSTIHTLRSPPDVNLRDLMNFLNQQPGPDRHFEWIGHCLIRRDLYNYLMQPGMMDTWIHPQAFFHFLSPSARQLILNRLWWQGLLRIAALEWADLLLLVAALKWADHFDSMVWFCPGCNFFSLADFELDEIPFACFTMLKFCYFVLVNLLG